MGLQQFICDITVAYQKYKVRAFSFIPVWPIFCDYKNGSQSEKETHMQCERAFFTRSHIRQIDDTQWLY